MIDSVVVLVVYGWRSVEPGILSWMFPSVAAAATAAHAMTNAVGWAILPGSSARSSIDAASDLVQLRAAGGVLSSERVELATRTCGDPHGMR